jgi:DNA ligase D-like protein (predicted polymerase)
LTRGVALVDDLTMSPAKAETLTVAGRDVRVTNPDKVFFPELGLTKMDVVRYYLDLAEAALVGCHERPCHLLRFPDGVGAENVFYQKRVPEHRPDWVATTTVMFPSGRTAEMLVMQDAAHLVWQTNLGCVDVNPWPVRRSDVDRPDELRVDLDPTPETTWDAVRRVALACRDVLGEHGIDAFLKTSGKRGMHVLVRIEPRWAFTTVRRAAVALAREVERRHSDATTAWWKEERRGVFLDYNQTARDRTTASAYSVRPVPDARVSTPLAWDEVLDAEPEDLTIGTVPARLRERGDPHAAIDERAFSIEPLLELADRDEAAGLEDAPWPPHFPKGDREPVRAAPSRRRSRRDDPPAGA